MEQNGLKRIILLVFFFILAAYSCWATSCSLHLLMPTVPVVLVWGITIAFFIIASYGSKMIVDSTNTKVYQENRRLKCVGGILLMLAFWIFCSMPTNTHTFFYNKKIGDVVTDDITKTQSYLNCISSRQVTLPGYDTLEADVRDLQQKMTNEFNGIGKSGRRGNGQYVADFMTQINAKLGSNIPINNNYNAHEIAILNGYNSAIVKELAKVKRNNYQAPTASVDEANILLDDLDVMADTIKTMVNIGRVDEAIIKQAEGVLQNAYGTIKNSQNFVAFNDKEDESKYTAPNIITDTKRMLSVFDVWMDYFKGKYKGEGFLFWIFISILVDLGAFIFFDLAFPPKEY